MIRSIVFKTSLFQHQLFDREQVSPDDLARGAEGRILQQVGRLRRRERRHQHQDHLLPLLRQQPGHPGSDEEHYQQVLNPLTQFAVVAQSTTQPLILKSWV